MLNAMVASTKKQAEALIAILARRGEIEPNQWIPVTYGQEIKNLYQHAKLIRPSEGVTKEHCDWVLGMLVPHLCLTVTTVPPHWKIPQEHVE
jgi:hypothetical protein